MQQKTRVSKKLVLPQNLLDNLLRTTHQQRAARPAQHFVVFAVHGGPAALAADAAHDVGVGAVKFVRRPLGIIGKVAVGIDGQLQFGDVVSGLLVGFLVKVGECHEAFRATANDSQRHRQAIIRRPDDRFWRPTHGHPNRQLLLKRSRIYAPAVDGWAQFALPSDLLAFVQFDE